MDFKKEGMLITFPDWEIRSVNGFKENYNKIKFSQVYLLTFPDGLHKQETDKNLKDIEDFSSENNVSVNIIQLSKDHSLDNWNLLEQTINKLEIGNFDVFLDITTMPRELIWILLFNLKKKTQIINYIYHKPQDYNQEWLTREPDTPRLLFKHSGIISLEKNTALIIIPGFDSERVSQLINFYNPKTVVLAFQNGTQFENHNRNNSALYKIETECLKINIDAYSANHGYDELKTKIIELEINHNIVIASLGPKLTAISLYRLYNEFPEIALSYVPCKDYNLKYSIGIGEMYQGVFNA